MIGIRVCPICASAKIDMVRVEPDVESDEVACSNCGWTGKHRDLINAAVQEDQIINRAVVSGASSMATEIAAEVAAGYLQALAKYAGRPIGLALVESGIVGTRDTKSIARLLRAACKGAHRATLAEVEKMQEEMQDERRSDAN